MVSVVFCSYLMAAELIVTVFSGTAYELSRFPLKEKRMYYGASRNDGEGNDYPATVD